jgi:Na+/melibiose symporter-like transporter
MDILIIFLPVTIFAIALIIYWLYADDTDKYNKIIAEQELKSDVVSNREVTLNKSSENCKQKARS